jgi:hypothetical protein
MTVTQLLDQLDQLKRDHSAEAPLHSLLTTLKQTQVVDAESLIRLHETLLFIRAYPQSARILKLADALLRSFPQRLAKAEDSGAELTTLDHPNYSGIAGRSVTDIFSYHIVRWLVERNSTQVSLHWEWFENENSLAELWPRFMPLLAEDALVEANVPYQKWLQMARGSQSELQWLLERFNNLAASDNDKARLFDGQQLYVTWSPDYRATRTGMRRSTRTIFYQRTPLIQRREVNFEAALSKPSPSFIRLSENDGRKALDLAREASTIRYRELYGFTHGDAKSVCEYELGRGFQLVVSGVPPEKRLPLRAVHAAMIYKNGVPVGYFEGLSLCERMEGGFNLYYTFRDGETAWLYAQILNTMRHLTGVSAFSLDPYQIGYQNKEGIESGAFWFYYKLGFRPTRTELEQLAQKETAKLTARKNYRTSAATLKKLATGPMILELDKELAGSWNNFQMRNIGFAVQRMMARKFQGDAEKMSKAAIESASRLLEIEPNEWLADFAPVLLLIPSIKNWTSEERKLLQKIIQAKANEDETGYLRMTQQHARFRQEILRLGNRRDAESPAS